MKAKLTSIASCAGDIATTLEEMRADVLECIVAIEVELRVVDQAPAEAIGA